MSSVMNYEENILAAIQTIVNDAVDHASYDRTIQATIKKVVDATIGKYRIAYQDSVFYAYATSADITYSVGTNVYVLIPGNDMSKTKTILGTVDNLGADFINILTNEEIYENMGVNIANSTTEFGLNSYVSEQLIKLYDKTEDINLINLNPEDAEMYIKQNDYITLGAYFKTNLSNEQKAKGNYGISFDFIYENELGENEHRICTIDIDSFNGSPYDLYTYIKQTSTYINFDKDKFKYIDSISIFENGFPYIRSGEPNDIFIKDIQIFGARKIPEEELASCMLSILTPQGTYFKTTDEASATKNLKAQIRVKGKIAGEYDETRFYWFRENASVTKNTRSDLYCSFGGSGWECLNLKNTLGNDIYEWVPADENFSVTKADLMLQENKYKCVALYNDDIVLSREITLYNKSAATMTIESSNGQQFYFDMGQTVLTCTLSEELPNLTYTWRNLYDILDDTTENITVQAKDINRYDIYQCTVYSGDNYVGTANIILYNSLDKTENTRIIINNGTQVFKYTVDGIAPNNNSLEKPITILPLSFTLFDDDGVEITQEKIVASAIEWLVPAENTMITIPDGYGIPTQEDGWNVYNNLRSLNFNILTRYDVNKENNIIKLRITLGDRVYTAETNLIFLKEGERGSNGTDFICKVIPNNASNIDSVNQPIVTVYNNNYSLNYTPAQTNCWFKVQLWHDGELIYEGATSGTSTEDKSIDLTWSVLQNSYSTTIKDNSNISINKNSGVITFNTTQYEAAANIVQCKVQYDGVEYYDNIPVVVNFLIDDNYQIQLKENSGFRYAIYESDGHNPKFDNATPFEILVIKNDTDISLDENITYSWNVLGTYYEHGASHNIENLIPITGYIETYGLTKNQKRYKPIDSYDGLCINNSIKCSVFDNGTEKGTIYIPIDLYINRYGNAALNNWNGNSIQIREEDGLILSPQIGAGKKENDNTFTGMFMGDVQENATTERETGLFGYYHGERTIELNAENGAAKFGKNGAGQIIINPSGDAILTSGNYSESEGTGMIINLSEPSIKFGSGNFEVDQDGNLSATAVEVVAKREIENSVQLFNINSSTNSILFAAQLNETDNKYYPIASGSYIVTLDPKYKNTTVTSATASFNQITGITTTYSQANKTLTFAVNSSTGITDLNNNLTVTYTYVDSSNKSWTDVQQYSINLVTQGKSNYIFYRYADDAQGTNMSTLPTATSAYLGIATSNVNQAPVSPTAYTWSLIKGNDGDSVYFGTLTNENHTFIYGRANSATTQVKGYYGATAAAVTLVSVDGVVVDNSSHNLPSVVGMSFSVGDNNIITFSASNSLAQGIAAQIPIVYQISGSSDYFTSYFNISSTTKGGDAQLATININSGSQVFKKVNTATYSGGIVLSVVFQPNTLVYGSWKYKFPTDNQWQNLSGKSGVDITSAGVVTISASNFFTSSSADTVTLLVTDSTGAVSDQISLMKIVDGEGVTVSSSIAEYVIANQGTTPPGDSANWQRTPIPSTTDNNPYLWTRNTITYSDGTQSISYNVSSTMDSLSSFISATNNSINDLQNQIDGAISTWFYGYTPTLSNAPASTWTTTEDKNKHLGDLFYVTGSSGDNEGKCYRFAYVNDTYQWILVEDADISKAIADAAAAQATADGKRTVYQTRPQSTTDLQSGDLLIENDDLYVWTGTAWVLATDYTNDDTANAALAEAKRARQLTLVLTNENQTLPAREDGTVISYSGATTTVMAYYGNTAIALSNISTPSATNVTGQWNSTTGEYTVQSLTADSGYVDFTVTYTPDVEIGQLSTTARFSLSKAKGGESPAIVDILTLNGFVFQGTAINTTEGTTGYTYSPDQITLTADLQNCSAGAWAYQYDGTTWNTPGTTVITTAPYVNNNGDLIIPKTVEAMKYVIRYTAANNAAIDYATIVKINEGVKGQKGATLYTWIKYADDAQGTNMSDNPTGKEYIGIAANKTTPTESSTASDYSWSKIQGDNGAGIDNIVYTYKATSTQSMPDAATIIDENIPTLSNTNKYLWQKEVITYTESKPSTTNVTLIAVYGDSGYNVNSDNESHNIAGDETKAIASSFTVNLTGYYGTEIKPITITKANITGIPSGMTVANPTYNNNVATLTFSVANTMTSLSGQITIPVTFTGTSVTINKTLSYVLNLKGQSAIIYEIRPNVEQIVKNSNTNVLNPTTITFTASYRKGENATETAYNGRWAIQGTTDNTSWSNIGINGASSNVSSVTSNTISNTYIKIRAILWAAGTTTTDVSQALDIQTIPVVESGKNGIDGKSIEVSGTNIEYANATQGTNPSTVTGWGSSVAPEEGKYHWTRTTTTYRFVGTSTSAGSSVSYTVAYSSKDGANILSMTPLYYLSTTGEPPSSAPIDGTQVTSTSTDANIWTTVIPTYIKDGVYYICYENHTSDTNNDYIHTTPYINDELNKIYNMQIGGRNLLKYTAYDTLDGVNNRGTYHEIEIGESYNNNKSLQIECLTPSVSGSQDIWQKCWTNQIVDQPLRLSFYIKGSVAAKMFIRLAGANSSNSSTSFQYDITTSWQYLDIDLGTVTSAGTAGETEIIYGFNTAGIYYINSMMLEYSNMASNWSPAPEDVDQSIDDVHDEWANYVNDNAENMSKIPTLWDDNTTNKTNIQGLQLDTKALKEKEVLSVRTLYKQIFYTTSNYTEVADGTEYQPTNVYYIKENNNYIKTNPTLQNLSIVTDAQGRTTDLDNVGHYFISSPNNNTYYTRNAASLEPSTPTQDNHNGWEPVRPLSNDNAEIYSCIETTYKGEVNDQGISTGNIIKYSTPTLEESYQSITDSIYQNSAYVMQGLKDGGNKIYYDTSGFYVFDQNTSLTAKKCIYMNSNGINFATRDTVGEPWRTSSVWTIDGTFDAQNIEVKNLSAEAIQNGVLTLGKINGTDGKMIIQDDAGTISFEANSQRVIYKLNNGGYIIIGRDIGFQICNSNGEIEYGSELIWTQASGSYQNNMSYYNTQNILDLKINYTEGTTIQGTVYTVTCNNIFNLLQPKITGSLNFNDGVELKYLVTYDSNTTTIKNQGIAFIKKY